ncbi:MAG: GreA/GreB family elongation factor, partial [Candidatus Falkowbacteria bacterium]|nr:GreA/GreB family elongation factor [Candidatus Falkowbacteria bacterium]
PLGRAFLNKKTGDTVIVITPKGETEYTIVKIE